MDVETAIDGLVIKLASLDLTDDEAAVFAALLDAAEGEDVQGFWDPGEYSPSSNFGLPDLRGRIGRIIGHP